MKIKKFLIYLCRQLYIKLYPSRYKLELFIIVADLWVRLWGRPEIISIAIAMAIEKKRPYHDVIDTCHQNIRDNEPVMIDILGDDLVTRIKRITELNTNPFSKKFKSSIQ